MTTVLTGTPDIDMNILSNIDDPFILADLYRSNKYVHDLLNSDEVLYLLSTTHDLPHSDRFQELLEDMIIKYTQYNHRYDVGKVAVRNDNPRLLIKVLNSQLYNNTEFPESNRDLTDEHIETLLSYQSTLSNLTNECIKYKSYKCLKVLGDYVMEYLNRAILYEHELAEEIIEEPIEKASRKQDYHAVDIILSWLTDGTSIPDILVDKILEYSIYQSDYMSYILEQLNIHGKDILLVDSVKKLIDNFENKLIINGTADEIFDMAVFGDRVNLLIGAINKIIPNEYEEKDTQIMYDYILHLVKWAQECVKYGSRKTFKVLKSYVVDGLSNLFFLDQQLENGQIERLWIQLSELQDPQFNKLMSSFGYTQ
jgi:hypothetical protein